MCKGLIDSDIGHEEYTLVINEEKNYFRLKKATEQKTISYVVLNGQD